LLAGGELRFGIAQSPRAAGDPALGTVQPPVCPLQPLLCPRNSSLSALLVEDELQLLIA
jgi:hypothetical protein